MPVINLHIGVIPRFYHVVSFFSGDLVQYGLPKSHSQPPNMQQRLQSEISY